MKLKDHQVYCGRGKGGAVPFKPRQYGWLGNPIARNKKCPNCESFHNEPGSTLSCYKLYLEIRLNDGEWFDCFIEDCRDKELWCFCKDKKTCHTSVMKEALDELLFR